MLFSLNYKKELLDYVKTNKNLFLSMNGKSFLITGAAGLIGSYMIDLLIAATELLGVSVKIYAVDKCQTLLKSRFPGDLYRCVTTLFLDVNEENMDTPPIDFLVHAASNTSPLDYVQKPVDTIRTNVIGTERMIRYAIAHGTKRFVFCSSVEIYGKNNGDTEDFSEAYCGYIDSNTLRSGYPTAKRLSESLCNAYASENADFEFVIARIGRIYGPTMCPQDTKAPSQFIQNAVHSKDVVLKSDGLQMYSYAYVGDCATALFTIMLKGKSGEAYNVADPNAKIRLRDFASFAAEAGETRLTFVLPTEVEKQGYSAITKATMNVQKLLSLGWKAKYDTQCGVARTIAHLKELDQSKPM